MVFEVKRVEHPDGHGRLGAGIALELPHGLNDADLLTMKVRFARAIGKMHHELKIDQPFSIKGADIVAAEVLKDMGPLERTNTTLALQELNVEDHNTGQRLIYLKAGYKTEYDMREMIRHISTFLENDPHFRMVKNNYKPT